MATVKLFLDKKRIDKNGESIVYVLVHIDYKSIKINTGIKTPTKKWDFKNNRIKGKTKEVIDANMIISKTVTTINEIFVKYRLENKRLTPVRLKEEIKNPTQFIDVHKFCEIYLKERSNEISSDSYRAYKSNLTIFKKFKAEIMFSDISIELFEDYLKYLKGLKHNKTTIYNKMRVMNIFMNAAKKRGIINQNPIEYIKVKKSKIKREFLTESELNKLRKAYENDNLTEGYETTARYFLFMCYTGLRLRDFFNIKKENFYDNALNFIPHKTKNSKPYKIKIPLNKYAIKLINDENSNTEYLFNPPSDVTLNVKIKKIMDDLKINKHISIHCGRHTFATLWLKKTNDIAILQKLLNHSNIQETMVYVHITDEDLVRQMKNFEDSFSVN